MRLCAQLKVWQCGIGCDPAIPLACLPRTPGNLPPAAHFWGRYVLLESIPQRIHPHIGDRAQISQCRILPIVRLIILPRFSHRDYDHLRTSRCYFQTSHNLTDASWSSLPICALVFIGKRFLGVTLLPTRVRDGRQYCCSCTSLPSPEFPIRYYRPVQRRDPTALPPCPVVENTSLAPKKSIDSRPCRAILGDSMGNVMFGFEELDGLTQGPGLAEQST